ncbi:MAG: hypothetical protein Q9162_006615 [Coniocarpon cinnabarinum]
MRASPDLRLTIQLLTANGEEIAIVPGTDFDSSATLDDLNMFLIGSADLPANYPEHKWVIRRESKTIAMPGNTKLSEAGIVDNDFLLGIAQPLLSQAPDPSSNGQVAPSAQSDNSASHYEALRQQILSHPPTRARIEDQGGMELTQNGESLDSVLRDQNKFRERWTAMEGRRRAEAQERQQNDMLLNNEITSENQEEILKRIWQEQTEHNARNIMDEHPELFASVTMLYINVEINGRPQKAFVDSGAQTTIISPQKAEECNLARHIDARFAGVARGVGTARTLGRIHQTTMTIQDPNGYTENLPCGFTVVVGNDIEIILGLDMLKRYHAKIDLEKNGLVFPNGAMSPFLPESEIPKGASEASLREEMDKAATQSAEAASAAKPAAGNFSGAGQTLGSRPAGAPSSSSAGGASPAAPPAGASQGRPAPALRPAQQSIQPSPSGPTAGAISGQPAVTDAQINQLMEQGATSRQQARELLQQAGGDMDMALSLLLFGM